MRTGHSWRAERFGEPGVELRWLPAQWPDPEPGRVLVQVHAVGVGLPDRLMVTGHYRLAPTPPVSPGQEVCGTVVAVAPGSAFTVGERIMGLTPLAEGHGGYGDFAYVRESKASRVPDHFGDIEAAGFMLAHRTAHAALITRLTLARGQTVGVLGAAGSSGLAAIGLARALGATVVAVAGGARKTAFCAEVGAQHTVDHRTAAVGPELLRITDGRGVDVLFDPVGGDLARAAVAGLRPGGHVAVIGYASGTWIEVPAAELVMNNHSLVGVFTGGFTETEDRAINSELTRLADIGQLTTALGPTYGLDEIPHVLQVQELGTTGQPGKIVVRREQSCTSA
jgi:NADPH2:quinone reductase